MGNRRHSIIDGLDPSIKDTVHEMLISDFRYGEIVDYLKQNGVQISQSAVCNYAKHYVATVQQIRMAQENFRALMEETSRYPDLDATDAILRLVSHKMLEAINKMDDEQLDGIDFDTLSRNATALTRAIAYKRNTDVKTRSAVDNGYEQFTSVLYETMATDDPELYARIKAYTEKKRGEINENVLPTD